MSKFIDSAQFRSSPKEGQRVQKGYSVQIKSLDATARTVSFVASTEAVDRMGDSIKLSGWRLDRFKQNPVILFGHDHDDLPIGKALSIGVEGDALVVVVQFASAEANPVAENVFRLIQEGCLNAVSVGFIMIRWEWVDDEENGRCGFDILEAELLEISVVPIPAHPDALVQAGMKGLDASPILEWMREQAGGEAPPAEKADDASSAPAAEPENDVKGDEVPMDAPEDDKPEGEDGCQGGKPKKGISTSMAKCVLAVLKLKGAA